ncbi:MAG: hypothetical protein ACYC5M_12660 [Anaerolineae bacterium]
MTHEYTQDDLATEMQKIDELREVASSYRLLDGVAAQGLATTRNVFQRMFLRFYRWWLRKRYLSALDHMVRSQEAMSLDLPF